MPVEMASGARYGLGRVGLPVGFLRLIRNR
jgi:hypothetical protein